MNGPLTRFDLYGLFDHDISESDFIMPTSYQDLRFIPELSAAGIERAGSVGISLAESLFDNSSSEDQKKRLMGEIWNALEVINRMEARLQYAYDIITPNPTVLL